MTLGFGLLSAQRVAGDDRTWEDVYGETIDLAMAVEHMGYDSLWTTEHHFVDDGYMPSLLVTSAAIASVTTTIAIGTGLVLAPMHRPIRLAEDAATVQVISNGRLQLGLGLGWSKIEYDVLGVDMATRGKAMSEMLEFLPLAWTGEPFTWEGDVYTFPELAVRPAPGKAIPLIVGGGVDAAVARAVRHADGFFSNATPDGLVRQVAVANKEMDRIGRDPSSFRWIYYGVMYPGPRKDILPSVWEQLWKYTDMEASAIRTGITGAPAPDQPTTEAVTARIFGGSSDEIIDALGTIREQVGVPIEWIARSYFPSMSHDRQLEVAQQLASEVLPFIPAG